MNHYRSTLTRHLKNQSKLIALESTLRHSACLDQASQEYGFSNWKQATKHMAYVDELVKQARTTFAMQLEIRAFELSKRRGYPFLVDEQTAMRYAPKVPIQAESVARNGLVLELFEKIHAPINLNKSNAAQLWFRPLLSPIEVQDLITMGRWRIKHLATAIAAAEGADVIVRDGYPNLTRSAVQDELVGYLHALYSQSVRLALGGGIDEVMEHPGFKEFAGCALHALRENIVPGTALTVVLEHAYVEHWVRSNSGSLDEHLVWSARQQHPAFMRQSLLTLTERPSFDVSSHLPVNELSLAQYTQLAALVNRIAKHCPDTRPVQRVLVLIGELLSGWMSKHFGDERQARAIFQLSVTPHAVAFLAPALARRMRSDLASLQSMIEGILQECLARKELLKAVRKLEKVVHAWIHRTQHDWSKKSVRLEMDSIGLVALDPKFEPYLEPDTPWRRAELIGTHKERNLLDALRPHLFPIWKQEDEQEGYDFNIEDMDCEESLSEHLHGLVFYRYVGPANTVKQFWKEVAKLAFFRPQHVWFKQKLID
ncbi:hypothetical protein D7241_06490 [Stutzerimonas sp. VN223-3]|uniref:hypothetical protein n=1 Tax=Stutzerimonas sp. VN223-3 TaxID=3384601 RepID=UPI0038B5BD82